MFNKLNNLHSLAGCISSATGKLCALRVSCASDGVCLRGHKYVVVLSVMTCCWLTLLCHVVQHVMPPLCDGLFLILTDNSMLSTPALTTNSDGHKVFILSLTLTKFPTKRSYIVFACMCYLATWL